MQNINGQWVNTTAIEALLDSLDRQLNIGEGAWLEQDEDLDAESTVEVRKAQYDSLVSGIYALNRRYIFARRIADEYQSEIVELKEQLHDLETFVMEDRYMAGWFDCLKQNDELHNYEHDKMLTDRDLPFAPDTQTELYDMGFERYKLISFAKTKYEEWKEEKNEGIQLDTTDAEE